MSFREALLGATGSYWLDDPSDVGCRERMGQHAVDVCPLFCNLLPRQKRLPTPKPLHPAWPLLPPGHQPG
jgi:hypothetical protein